MSNTINPQPVPTNAGQFDNVKVTPVEHPASGFTSGGSVDVTKDCNTNTVNGTKDYCKMSY